MASVSFGDGQSMGDLAIVSYFVIGATCAVGCRLLLRWSKIKVTNYWSVILGGGSEAIVITVLFWPITLITLLLYYLLQRCADHQEAKFRAADAERRRKEREDPLSTLTIDQLLAKIDEHKKEVGHKS